MFWKKCTGSKSVMMALFNTHGRVLRWMKFSTFNQDCRNFLYPLYARLIAINVWLAIKILNLERRNRNKICIEDGNCNAPDLLEKSVPGSVPVLCSSFDLALFLLMHFKFYRTLALASSRIVFYSILWNNSLLKSMRRRCWLPMTANRLGFTWRWHLWVYLFQKQQDYNHTGLRSLVSGLNNRYVILMWLKFYDRIHFPGLGRLILSILLFLINWTWNDKH